MNVLYFKKYLRSSNKIFPSATSSSNRKRYMGRSSKSNVIGCGLTP